MSENAAVPRFYLVPSTALGRIEDVLPERLTNPAGDWVAHSREILKKKRQAAARGQWKPTHPIGDDHAHFAAFGAESCPAMKEMDSAGWILKWPATAVLRQAAPKGWEVKPSTNYNFFHYSPHTTFPDAGEAEAIVVETGFTVVTPPGWSVLVKSLPNQFAASPKSLVFAEGVVRSDQATYPLKLHALIRGSKPEIKIKRGDPMIAIFPFKRETMEMAVMDDPALREEAERLAEADRAAFANAPGTYRKLYIDDTNHSSLYPRLDAAFRKSFG